MKNKKILIIGTTIMLLFTLFSNVTAFSIKNKSKNEMMNNSTVQNQIFLEFVAEVDDDLSQQTASLLENIYNSDGYNFKYMTIIENESYPSTVEKVDDYKIAGYPTCIFQGGLDVLYKGQPLEDIYKNKILQAGNRIVHDLDIIINKSWHATCCDAEADFKVEIINNEGTTYLGSLRLYITEIDSRWGYKSEDENRSYHYALIDTAMEEYFSIAPYSNETFETTWSATPFFINARNIDVFAVVSNRETHETYSDPPTNENKFYAHYVDQIETKRIVSKSKIKTIDENPIQRFSIFQKILNLLHRSIDIYPHILERYF